MEIIVHKGTDEIGGTCIQLSTESTTILLDIGKPLNDESKPIDYSVLEPDAILLSHPHQDHYGMIKEIDPKIPIYIGIVGKELINATAMFLGREFFDNNFQPITRDKPFSIGDLKITPYLVDHSAVDAFAFLIESEDKRIFYSGDFRAHGRKSVLFKRILEDPPKDIDLVLMEGTMIERKNEEFPDEQSVENKLDEILKAQKNISFIISSSQNIDRIVSIYRSCLKNDKILIIDFYTAWVLEQLKLVSDNVPNMEWDNIKVYADYNQDQKLKDNLSKTGDFRKRAYKHRIKKEEIQADPSKHVYFSKMSKFKIIDLYKSENNPVNVIYSQWLGYLEQDGYGSKQISAYKDDKAVNFYYAHTSGHATIEDLKKFAESLKPNMIIPIHTEFKNDFETHFNNMKVLDDNELLKI